jgi:hypothetical protein
MANNEMAGEVTELYGGIRQDLIRLYANWQIFRQLFATSDERYEILNGTAPGFFKLIQDALVDNAVIGISRLTDPSRHASLERLVIALKNQIHHTTYETLQERVASLRAKSEDIREHRDKRVAHRGRDVSPPQFVDGPQKLPPITRKMIEDALSDTAEIMNEVLSSFESVHQVYEPVVTGDADALLHFLELGYEATQSLQKE